MSTDLNNVVPAFDTEYVQRVVLRSLIAGNESCCRRLPELLGAFEEPYRTVAGETLRLRQRGQFVDDNVLGGALAGTTLSRCAANGHAEWLSAGQALSLVGQLEVDSGQAEAYLDLLADRLEEKRRQEFAASTADAVRRYSEQPEALVSQLQRLVADHQSRSQTADETPCELLELIPYMQALETRQRGNAYLGLDSGFEHLNNLCNGLDTGLFVLAAPPGEGKTTLAWQIGCQVAESGIPVLFLSFEQSKNELRAKVLARLSHLDYRHILRGRLQAGDPCNWPQVLGAAFRYGQFAHAITIVEADENTTIADIRSQASSLKARHNAPRCLIIIDYLQIIPLEEKEKGKASSPKEKLDLHVSALRRLARDLDSPILAISSENRASYRSARLDAFKESGIIEYSADVAAVMKRGDAEGDPSSDGYRTEELRIIKNRNGECGVITFRFYAQRMEFVEIDRRALEPEE